MLIMYGDMCSLQHAGQRGRQTLPEGHMKTFDHFDNFKNTVFSPIQAKNNQLSEQGSSSRNVREGLNNRGGLKRIIALI